MTKTEEMLLLLDLQKELAYIKFDSLDLTHLNRLRSEVDLRIKQCVIEDMKNSGKSEEEIRAYIKESYLK